MLGERLRKICFVLFCSGWEYSEVQLFYLFEIDNKTIQLFHCSGWGWGIYVLFFVVNENAVKYNCYLFGIDNRTIQLLYCMNEIVGQKNIYRYRGQCCSKLNKSRQLSERCHYTHYVNLTSSWKYNFMWLCNFESIWSDMSEKLFCY